MIDTTIRLGGTAASLSEGPLTLVITEDNIFLEAASAMQAALLVAEGLRLCGLVHTNVLAPVAACAEDPRRPLLVYCSASHSCNLKRYVDFFLFFLFIKSWHNMSHVG